MKNKAQLHISIDVYKCRSYWGHGKDYGNSEELQVSMAEVGEPGDTKIVVSVPHNKSGRVA